MIAVFQYDDSSCYGKCKEKVLYEPRYMTIYCGYCHWKEMPVTCMAETQTGVKCKASLNDRKILYCHRHLSEIYRDQLYLRAKVLNQIDLAAFADLVEFPEKVYFIKCHDYIKIGRSISPDSRLKSLQGKNDKTLKPLGMDMDKAIILKTIKGGAKVESQLHWHLDRWRVVGEWFRATDEVLSFIDNLN